MTRAIHLNQSYLERLTSYDSHKFKIEKANLMKAIHNLILDLRGLLLVDFLPVKVH